MNVHEWGVTFAFSTGFDMSAKTVLAIRFWKPDNVWSEDTDSTPSLTKTASVGSGPITTTEGVFVDKKYATCVFEDGDVDQVGEWSARVVYTDATGSGQHLISDVATFEVFP